MSTEEIWGRRLGLQASDITLNNFLLGKTFDWYDHSFHTGLNQDYNVSISGNNEKVNYYLSLGYLSNEGVARGNEYSAIRSNMKLNAQITSWLNVGANINFQNRTDGDIATNWESQILDNSPFTSPYKALYCTPSSSTSGNLALLKQMLCWSKTGIVITPLWLMVYW